MCIICVCIKQTIGFKRKEKEKNSGAALEVTRNRPENCLSL